MKLSRLWRSHLGFTTPIGSALPGDKAGVSNRVLSRVFSLSSVAASTSNSSNPDACGVCECTVSSGTGVNNGPVIDA